MVLKWFLFLAALTAHVWLWGQWSLEASNRMTLMLVVPSILLFVMFVVPMRAIFKKQNPTKAFYTLWMTGIFYLYIVAVIVMGVFHFSGLIQILLPLIVVLLGCYLYLAYKLKPNEKPKNLDPKPEPTPDQPIINKDL